VNAGQDHNALLREPCSAEQLVVGLQCGGSDGYSGISANPALGYAVDLLVAHGGAAILRETKLSWRNFSAPEMYRHKQCEAQKNPV